MRKLRVMVSRNLLLFWNNKTNVLLCFFAVITVLGLYVLFLRDFMIQYVEHAGLEHTYVNEFVDRLMVSGLLTVINTTTCFGIMQMSVADVATGVTCDFLVTPVTRFQLEVGYWVTSIIVSFLYSVMTLSATEYYFCVVYEEEIHWGMFSKSLFILLFSSCMNSGLLICFVRFMKDTTSFSTFGNLYGLLCGFFAGTYLPYSLYPEKLRNLLFYFPPMQLTSILRQNNLSAYQENGKAIGEHLYQIFGVRLVVRTNATTMREQWSYLMVAMAVVLLIVRIENCENEQISS